jgi:hypothetical protein
MQLHIWPGLQKQTHAEHKTVFAHAGRVRSCLMAVQAAQMQCTGLVKFSGAVAAKLTIRLIRVACLGGRCQATMKSRPLGATVDVCC